MTAPSHTPTASASCPTTRCSTSAATSTSIRIATPACSRSAASTSAWSSARTCGSPSRWPKPCGWRATGAGAECLAVRARQARAARCAARATRARDRCRVGLPQPGRRPGCGRVRWRLGTGRWRWRGASGRGRVRRPVAGRRFRSGNARLSSAVEWMVDGDESRGALAWRAVVRGTRDYCLQERLRQGVAGPVRWHRLLDRAGDRGRCARRRQRHRGADAVALHRRPVQRPRRRAVHRAGRAHADAADREAVPGLPRRARRDLRRHARRYHRGKPAVAHPRRIADGAEQQVRWPVADHRQQERIRGRLRDDLWRHVRRLRADQGPVQDRGVRAGALAQHRRWHPGHPGRR